MYVCVCVCVCVCVFVRTFRYSVRPLRGCVCVRERARPSDVQQEGFKSVCVCALVTASESTWTVCVCPSDAQCEHVERVYMWAVSVC